MKQFITSLLVLLNGYCIGQNFVNGDLEGVPSGVDVLPPSWDNVSYVDSICQATHLGWDTPDVTDINGPSDYTGIYGVPQSGLAFVSGNYGGNSSNFWQEGIQQTVSGFLVNEIYKIDFYQTIVKFFNALDGSGSWIVYVDNNIIDTTTISYSNLLYQDSNLIWDYRSVNFIATKNSHTLKFLPLDDDNNNYFSTNDTLGGLRMGIDNINLSKATNINKQIVLIDVSLYPNPTFGQVSIRFDELKKAPFIKIRNSIGQIVFAKQYNNTLQIDLDLDIPNGIYFLQVESEGEIISKKIIKQ